MPAVEPLFAELRVRRAAPREVATHRLVHPVAVQRCGKGRPCVDDRRLFTALGEHLSNVPAQEVEHRCCLPGVLEEVGRNLDERSDELRFDVVVHEGLETRPEAITERRDHPHIVRVGQRTGLRRFPGGTNRCPQVLIDPRYESRTVETVRPSETKRLRPHHCSIRGEAHELVGCADDTGGHCDHLASQTTER